ncbi:MULTISPECIES: hypothetical protein [Arthrobacter]|uniref:Uncharacterized protein n=1 Tax=Arthrobacter terricola TaxID=2547396 RepID=A0A4R5KB94_9MICC|nr:MULTISPECIES: hypothetical protein [Arthrobacter]MBT8163009.1 hypothetical protein [Arthrobacter sp. GN70]TDF91785.1 hypothetical protein E1809_19905 [Arthrobacter terricola]
MNKRNAIILASPGGVSYEGGGAHVVVNHIIEGYPELAAQYDVFADSELHIIGASLDSSSRDYRPDLLRRAESTASTFNGGVHLVGLDKPFEGFRDVYADSRDIERRKLICKQYAGQIISISEKYDRTVVLAHEDHLAWLPNMLGVSQQDCAKIAIFWFPHVLSTMYPTVYEERLAAERESLESFRDQDRGVAVGKSVRTELLENYGVTESQLVDCFNEVYPGAERYQNNDQVPAGILEREFAAVLRENDAGQTAPPRT